MASRYLNRVPPSGPLHVVMGEALSSNETLGSLMLRFKQSQQRLACVAPLLPPALLSSVHPGPLDDEGWSLLVANAAAASKLRQLMPRLSDELRKQGWPELPIRLRLQLQR